MNQNPHAWMTGLIAYFPLLAIVLEVIWVILMTAALIFSVGDTPYVNDPNNHTFSRIASLPVLLGTMVGIYGIITRCPNGIAGWICLILGTILCGLILYSCLS